MAGTMGAAQAQAVHGPSGAAEFAAGQTSANGAEQAALSGMASRAGAIQAPGAFTANQGALFTPSLAGAGNALGADAGAAGGYSGALNSAIGAYGSAIHSPDEIAAAQHAAQIAANSAQMQDVTSLHRYFNALQGSQTQQAANATKSLAASKQATLDSLASNSSMSSDSYDILKATLAKNGDLPTAIASLNSNLTSSIDPSTIKNGVPTLDKNGNPTYIDAKGNQLSVDPQAIRSALLDAYQASPDFRALVHSYSSDSATGPVQPYTSDPITTALQATGGHGLGISPAIAALSGGMGGGGGASDPATLAFLTQLAASYQNDDSGQ